MDKIYDKCCGIDVHKKIMVACFIHGKEQEIREFGATTRELLALADWLEQGGCEMVQLLIGSHCIISWKLQICQQWW